MYIYIYLHIHMYIYIYTYLYSTIWCLALGLSQNGWMFPVSQGNWWLATTESMRHHFRQSQNRWWKCKTWQLFRLLNWIIHSLPFGYVWKWGIPPIIRHLVGIMISITIGFLWGTNQHFQTKPFTIIDQFPKLGIYCQMNLNILKPWPERTWGENETFKGRLGKVLPDANGEADMMWWLIPGLCSWLCGEHHDPMDDPMDLEVHMLHDFQTWRHIFMHKHVQTSENHWELSFHMTI